MHRFTVRFSVRLILLLGLLLSPLTGCSTNPATGESQFNMVSTSQEISIGEQAAPEFLSKNGGELPSRVIVEYVRSIGAQLAAASERPDLPWEFHVIDSAQINAFALPGGKVFFSRGLLAKFDNEAQLAGVLGHEVGHVTAQHIGQQMSQRVLAAGIVAAIGVGAQVSDNDWMKVLGVGAQAGGGLYLLKFGRDQESEADTLGMRYMTRLGYNPVGMLQVMHVLAEASGGGGAAPEWLSTHPLPSTRIERVTNLIKTKYPDYENEQKYAFNHLRFKEIVIANLANLPPPRHGRSADAGGGADAALASNGQGFTCWCGGDHTEQAAAPINPRLRAAFQQRQAIDRD